VEWQSSVPEAATITHVTDEGRNTGDATVVVHTAEVITLTPFCVERPKVISTNMPRMDDRQVTNFPIKIKFNKALDETTVGMDDIVITGTRQNASAETEVTTLTDHFERLPLDENGTLLRLEAKTTAALGGGPLANQNITVVVGPDIREAEYGVSMASREVFSYGVNDGPDNNPPVIIGTLYGVRDSDGEFFTTETYQNYPLPYGDETVWLVFDAFEDMGNIRDIRILEEFVQDNSGGNGISITDVDTHPGLRNIQAVRNSTSPLRLEYQGRDNNMGVDPFIIPYTLQYPLEGKYGITALHVQPSDEVGNRGDYILRVWTEGENSSPGPVQDLRASYSATAQTITLNWTNPYSVISVISSIEVGISPSAGTVTGVIDTTAGAETGCTITGIGVDNHPVYTISVTVKGGGLQSPPVTVRLSPYVDEMSTPLAGTVTSSIGTSGGPFYHGSGTGTTINVPVPSFNIGTTEVTYALWWTVYQWATSADRGDRKYTFANAGRAGANTTSSPVGSSYGDGAEPTLARKNHPAAFVSWRDAVVFCNAYSEMMGLEPVYRTNGSDMDSEVLRVSEDSASYQGSANTANRAADGSGVAEAVVASNYLFTGTNAGYRLPLEKEWEFAARGGSPSTTTPWTFSYSGSYYPNTVAWYQNNAGSTVGGGSPDYGTHPVKTKAANIPAGLYDMSGNLYEWCQEIYSSTTYRVIRGGYWGNNDTEVALSRRNYYYPSGRLYYIGFRLAQSN
jgi:formylglycine-generating enzyme required for sulfatase activity